MAITKLRDAGLKITQQRLAVLNYLENKKLYHFTAEDLFNSFHAMGEHIGLTTIYRVLSQLENAGILMRHYFDGVKAYYELQTNHHHDHLVCLRCGKIVEFFDPEIENRQHEIAALHDINLTHHHLYLFGYCLDPNCHLKP